MMKKWIISLIALCLVGSIGMFYVTKQNVDAEGIVLSKKVFEATFSDPVSEQDLTNGNVYLQDIKGNKIDANYVLSEDGKSLEIADLEDGNYVLFVKKKYGMGKTRYTFTVTNEIPTVNTRDELITYFDEVKKAGPEDKRPSTGASENTESSNSDRVQLDFSTTDNQVEDVEEADIVKTDGKHIFSLSEDKVSIVNVENPNEMTKVSTISFDKDFFPSKLLIKDQVLMVIGQKTYYQTVIVEDENGEQTEVKDEEEIKTIEKPLNPMTAVYFYDISNPKYPSQKREMASEGKLNGVRLNGDTLYLVTTSSPDIWSMENDEDVELRPYVFDSKSGKKAKILGYGNIAILPDTLDGVYTIISALDTTDLELNKTTTKSFLGSSGQTYMSKDHLYLASYVRKDDKGKLIEDSAKVNTEIYKFKLKKDEPVLFEGSHRMEGAILNQSSMDEYNGFFRAVTTDNLFEKDELSSGDQEKERASEEDKLSENSLYILDKDMKPVSSLTDLANGEKISSAKFMGDKAYVMTFKETDPLFAIDVSDPLSPKELGELKVPGFSNYLTPLDENHLISFGYETTVSPPEGAEQVVQTGGMKVTLFNVTDSTNPLEVDSVIIGGRGTYSAIHHDYQALFQHQEKQLYGFPVSVYNKTPGKDYDYFQREGAVLYEITPEKGISLKAELWNEGQGSQKQPDWNMMVQRIIYMDDSIFTVAAQKINSYSSTDYSKLSDINF